MDVREFREEEWYVPIIFVVGVVHICAKRGRLIKRDESVSRW